MHKEELCPCCNSWLIELDAEDIGNDMLSVRYRCEDCGAVITRTYYVKLVSQQIEP